MASSHYESLSMATEQRTDRPAHVFVVHWNQPDECIATVNALCAQEIPLQITIIDNNSAPEAIQNLKSKIGPEIQVVRLEGNRGWGGALNVVLKPWLAQNRRDVLPHVPGRAEARPSDRNVDRYCFISAHDAIPEPGCLRLLLEAAEADARVGIACPQYREPFVGRFSSARGIFPENVPALSTGTAQVVDVPHGTLMLCRRECLQQIGLFDERYFAYGDEHELGLRARRHGWKVVMVWGAIVTNPGTWTESPLRSYLFARNSLLLVRDYAGRWQALLRALLILLNTFRLMIQSPGKAFAFSARARFQAVTRLLPRPLAAGPISPDENAIFSLLVRGARPPSGAGDGALAIANFFGHSGDGAEMGARGRARSPDKIFHAS